MCCGNISSPALAFLIPNSSVCSKDVDIAMGKEAKAYVLVQQADRHSSDRIGMEEIIKGAE